MYLPVLSPGGTVTVSQAVAQALGISGMTNRIVRKVEMQVCTLMDCYYVVKFRLSVHYIRITL